MRNKPPNVTYQRQAQYNKKTEGLSFVFDGIVEASGDYSYNRPLAKFHSSILPILHFESKEPIIISQWFFHITCTQNYLIITKNRLILPLPQAYNFDKKFVLLLFLTFPGEVYILCLESILALGVVRYSLFSCKHLSCFPVVKYVLCFFVKTIHSDNCPSIKLLARILYFPLVFN